MRSGAGRGKRKQNKRRPIGATGGRGPPRASPAAAPGTLTSDAEVGSESMDEWSSWFATTGSELEIQDAVVALERVFAGWAERPES